MSGRYSNGGYFYIGLNAKLWEMFECPHGRLASSTSLWIYRDCWGFPEILEKGIALILDIGWLWSLWYDLQTSVRSIVPGSVDVISSSHCTCCTRPPKGCHKDGQVTDATKYCQSEIILGGSWFPVRDSRSCVSNKASSPRSDGPRESSPVQLSIKRLCSQSGLLWPSHPKPGSKRLIDKVPKDFDVAWTIPCYILMRGRYVHMLWLIAKNLLFNPRHKISQTLCRNQIEPYLSLSINSTIKISQI
jgi:hypothetical protein